MLSAMLSRVPTARDLTCIPCNLCLEHPKHAPCVLSVGTRVRLCGMAAEHLGPSTLL